MSAQVIAPVSQATVVFMLSLANMLIARKLNYLTTSFSNPFMNKKITLTVFTSLIATAIFALEPPPVGSAAPDFSLPDAKGETHSLSQYKGKYVVLEWFNPECPFVKKHYGSGNMQKLQKEYEGKGVVWMSIDSSAPGKEGNLTPEAATKKASEWKMNSKLLLDPEGKMDEAGERGDDAGHEDHIGDDCCCECHACIIRRAA